MKTNQSTCRFFFKVNINNYLNFYTSRHKEDNVIRASLFFPSIGHPYKIFPPLLLLIHVIKSWDILYSRYIVPLSFIIFNVIIFNVNIGNVRMFWNFFSLDIKYHNEHIMNISNIFCRCFNRDIELHVNIAIFIIER